MPMTYAIKYSHRYFKMPSPELMKAHPTRLLQVFCCDASELTLEFRDYDTAYYDREGKIQHYPLPSKGPVLVLFLRTGPWNWTTIREERPGKRAFYLGLQGQRVESAFVSEVKP